MRDRPLPLAETRDVVPVCAPFLNGDELKSATEAVGSGADPVDLPIESGFPEMTAVSSC